MSQPLQPNERVMTNAEIVQTHLDMNKDQRLTPHLILGLSHLIAQVIDQADAKRQELKQQKQESQPND